ncbi:MAG: SCO family protein, partial [Pseudomonadota bacterium]
DQFASCRASSIAGGAASIGGPFELVNGAGDTVTDADVITKPSLLYFGYTFCPDVCPFDVARNADAVDLLETDAGLEITPVFISIDPARDTPAVVADYGDVMHDRMVALTGSPQQVASASQAYRAYYKAHDSGDEFYLVDHSTFTYLVFPEHGFVEFYRRELTAEEMAASVACFVENA